MSKSITIDGVEYVPAGISEPGEVRIVILQRGWVMVGRWAQTGTEVTLTGASVIRKWGTTKGLGELVGGPLADTVLDPCGLVTCHEMTVVAAITADASKWAEYL